MMRSFSSAGMSSSRTGAEQFFYCFVITFAAPREHSLPAEAVCAAVFVDQEVRWWCAEMAPCGVLFTILNGRIRDHPW